MRTQRVKWTTWAAGCGFLLVGCASAFDASTTAGAVMASNRFGFDLYQRVKVPGDNLICSPMGAAVALTMTSAGARGETQTQMARVLHLDAARLGDAHASFASLHAALNDRNGKDGVMLSVANMLWGQEGLRFRPDFLSLLKDRYRAPLRELDFLHAHAAAHIPINQWASDETHGRIKDLIPPRSLGEQTRLVLTNAVYFKGQWQHPFDQGATRDDDFVTAGGKVKAKMMEQGGTFDYAEAGGVQIVEMPYKGDLAMVVILPEDADGLAAAEQRIGGNYDRWMASLAPTLVNLRLPRWTTTSALSLGDVLAAMGMPLAFEQHKADFTGMVEPKDLAASPGGEHLFISQVLQKAFVETNEVGTEAAAVTAVMIEQEVSLELPRRKVVKFHADHPFLYLLRDRVTGAILFVGRVVVPG